MRTHQQHFPGIKALRMYSLKLSVALSALLAIFVIVISAAPAWAQTASISGVVADPSGAVVAGATVILQDSDGIQKSSTTAGDGSYTVPGLFPGNYRLEVNSSGFQPFLQNGLVLAAAPVKFDVTLDLVSANTTVEVSAESVQIDLSDAEVGETIAAAKLTGVPLNGRSFIDLLAIQPGVIPASSAQTNAVVMSGCTSTPPSGDLNPGNMSVSGQRETANGFAVNGSNVEESFNNGTAVVPNLDSIQDLRVLTNTFDAEYGNYSGGQVLVATKSGNNQIHGSAFEFLRNTGLDARNYFGSERAQYDRNQYGGTVGGPIRKDKAYFFLDYQGTRMTQGQETGNIVVPSVADRSGNLADLSSQLTGTVSTQYWAQQLQSMGVPATVGEPYSAVFPSGVIPQSAWSAPAKALLQYIPQPNVGTNLFSSSSENETLGDNKAAARFDANTRFGNLTGYYFLDQYALDNPYPTAQGGANVPGFNALSNGRAQLFSGGLTTAWGSNTVNEARISYMRFANVIGQPKGGVGPSLASQGFVEGLGTLGIVPLNPATEGIENVLTASTFRGHEFAEAYGVDVTSGPLTGLTARAVASGWSVSSSTSRPSRPAAGRKPYATASVGFEATMTSRTRPPC